MTASPAGRNARQSPGERHTAALAEANLLPSSDRAPAAMKVTIPLRAYRRRSALTARRKAIDRLRRTKAGQEELAARALVRRGRQAERRAWVGDMRAARAAG